MHSQRQLEYPPASQDWTARPTKDPISPYAPSSHGSPGNRVAASYQVAPIQGSNDNFSSYQRPLPSAFPTPSSLDETAGQYISHATPAWQHHHHFPHSASTSYPANQDRYICGTCSKAFSRPSSLKIHTYSHTGEREDTMVAWAPSCGRAE